MMALPHDEPAETPRLDVRLAGRTTTHALTKPEFVIGSGLGCDLRIPGQQVPATFCTILRDRDGMFQLRPLSETHPILVNGQVVSQPIMLNDRDRLTIGPADVVLRLEDVAVSPRLFRPENDVAYLHPKFVHEDSESGWTKHTLSETPAPAYETSEPAMLVNLEELHAQLLARSRELDERAKELEEDRVLWYRRRQELETELIKLRESAPPDDWRHKEAELATKELDLARIREELTTLRQSLYDHYRERRDQISELQDQVRASQAAVAEREKAVAERERLAEARWAEAESIRTAVAQYEPRLKELATREGQIESALAEIERQRSAAAQLRNDLARDRETFDHERTLHETRWAEQNTALTVRDTELRRREDELRQGYESLSLERSKAVHAVSTYDSRFAELDEHRQMLERRAAEIDARNLQLAHDAAELEEQLRQVETERQQAVAIAERLQKQTDDLRAREQQLADKAAAVDAQQASLIVLRSTLDRRQAELDQGEADVTRIRFAISTSQSEIEQRLTEAQTIRTALGQVQTDTESRVRLLDERQQRLDAELAQLHAHQSEMLHEAARLVEKEKLLDDRTADLAEQAAILKARVQQLTDLQERLELDRHAVRERERSLGESDSARLSLQDQLRKRADELQTRSKALDEWAVSIERDRVAIQQKADALALEREKLGSILAQKETEWAAATAEHDRVSVALAEREQSLARQVARLREVGQTVAAERKNLFEAKQEWERTRAAGIAEDDQRTRFVSLKHQEFVEKTEELHRRLPELEQKAAAMLNQVAAARDTLRGQLNELHAFADEGRTRLEAARQLLSQEAEQLRDREAQIEAVRTEHRKQVSEYRQQLVQWQAQVGELRQSLLLGESHIGDRHAEMESIRKVAEEKAKALAQQERELQDARRQVDERRGELDRHLNEMREWYKKKMRELANGSIHLHRDTPDQTDLTPGDQHLGELLRQRDLVDARTLQTLWAEAARQRRTLRQVLLSSGTLTLYQLALIEAGNLDALMVGRFRVIDRVPSSNKEVLLKVFDPERAGDANHGIVMLRLLGDSELHDAVRPDEFRQRFATLAMAQHPNLANIVDVIDVSGRPAAIQEWVGGLVSGEWPHLPVGVWLKLLTDSASGLAALHRVGIAHGRLAADAISLLPIGLVKLSQGGLPQWLDGQTEPGGDPFDHDLRRLGEIATDWAGKAPTDGRKGRKAKPLPDPLQAMLRRLAAATNGSHFPMADEVARAEPYADADHFLVDLHRLSAAYPCASHEWAAMLDYVSETMKGAMPLRKAG